MDKSGDAAENRTTSPELSARPRGSRVGKRRPVATDPRALRVALDLVLQCGQRRSHGVCTARSFASPNVHRLDRAILRRYSGAVTQLTSAIFAGPPQMEMAAIWGWRYAAGATATGCLWGLTAAGILITPNPADHAFIAFVVSGTMAGAVAGDSAFLPALIGFAVPAALPITFAFFARGDPTSTIMGFLVAAFTAVLGIVGFRSNRWIASVARREIIQRGLATDLVRRITERQAAERDLHRSNKILQAVAESATAVLRSARFRPIKSKGSRTDRPIAGRELRPLVREQWRCKLCSLRAPYVECYRRRPHRSRREAFGSLPELKARSPVSFSRAAERLSSYRTNEVDDADRSFLETCGVQSFLLVPVFTGGIWWGALGVGDGEANRSWLRVEIDALRTLADIVGSAIAHTRDLTEIADAGRIVESGSTMLYRLRPKVPLCGRICVPKHRTVWVHSKPVPVWTQILYGACASG